MEPSQGVRGKGDEKGLRTSVPGKFLSGVNPVMTWMREEGTPPPPHKKNSGSICLGGIVLKENIESDVLKKKRQ